MLLQWMQERPSHGTPHLGGAICGGSDNEAPICREGDGCDTTFVSLKRDLTSTCCSLPDLRSHVLGACHKQLTIRGKSNRIHSPTMTCCSGATLPIRNTPHL